MPWVSVNALKRELSNVPPLLAVIVWYSAVPMDQLLCETVDSFSFYSRWHRSARKDPYALLPVSQQFPQGCPRNSASVCLFEHGSSPTSEDGTPADSFVYSFFLQTIDAVMLGLSMFRQFLKPLGTSSLPNCIPDVMSSVLASLSARSFPLTPAWPDWQIEPGGQRGL